MPQLQITRQLQSAPQWLLFLSQHVTHMDFSLPLQIKYLSARNRTGWRQMTNANVLMLKSSLTTTQNPPAHDALKAKINIAIATSANANDSSATAAVSIIMAIPATRRKYPSARTHVIMTAQHAFRHCQAPSPPGRADYKCTRERKKNRNYVPMP